MKNKNLDNIKLIIADVDGTLTDGGMYISESGEHMKKFNAKDGLAMKALMEKGYHVGIISASFSKNTIITRAKMLGLKLYYVGENKKTAVLSDWCKELNLEFNQVAYIGDDINDKEIMEQVGFCVCPSDAVESIKKTADVVLNATGGNACFREFADRFFLEG